ncbi:hypothetical protein VX159_00570 [Dechloromonas sp. ZY10]|uniref:hypothetical protein n=1 Tax=Dechloromonas aquae TaxID=2664436 RepID=UPI00352988D1
MPITVTFDFDKPKSVELNRIRGAFERLGWEHLGNTAYRYPKLHAGHPTEDWFNHVVPALMLLRTFAREIVASGRTIKKFSVDANSSTGYNPTTDIGVVPLAAADITYSTPSTSGQQFGQANLETWLDGVTWPYP